MDNADRVRQVAQSTVDELFSPMLSPHIDGSRAEINRRIAMPDFTIVSRACLERLQSVL